MKYKALTTVHHDCVVYAIGDEIELSDAEANGLLEATAIEPIFRPFSKDMLDPYHPPSAKASNNQFEKTNLHSKSLEH
jgi:hypothetical protein